MGEHDGPADADDSLAMFFMVAMFLWCRAQAGAPADDFSA